MSEEATTTTAEPEAPQVFLRIGDEGALMPFIPVNEMTNVEVDWVERQTEANIDAALVEDRVSLNVAMFAVVICRASPALGDLHARLNKAAEPLWDLPRSDLQWVQKFSEAEAGPTEPADEPAKEEKPAATKRARTSAKSTPAGPQA